MQFKTRTLQIDSRYKKVARRMWINISSGLHCLMTLLFLTHSAQALALLQSPSKDNASHVSTATAHIAVASNFIRPMQALQAEFEKDGQYKLTVSFASSGKIYAQIIHGAPFDVFLSADTEKPEALESKSIIISGERFVYAQGQLVLWSSSPGESDLLTKLRQNDFNKLALANPRFAPYGQAAVSALRNLSLEQSTKTQWVMGESISQTFQFVASGNADLGFIAYSQLPSSGQYVLVDPLLYAPINQEAVMLKRAAQNLAAKAFFDFLKSNVAADIIKANGYRVIEK